ncbi:DUF2807 domain-containing protein [Elizabethkingia argentiflava]|uniref:DUF2807 domain-containing protein n=1 Tax=Elizabethkingia argenteiflava TaxID=2681556 RepID=A0A845PZE0_9FLAO|nr:DUF2807 domain-containing protein [Elizabethkingia argenteiflava]NAW51807.1 DUF2807 domain-containing protein [Elizabethkingia argenteiflava]
MKKTNMYLLGLLILLSSCIDIKSIKGKLSAFTQLKGTGPITKKVYPGDFSSVEVSSGIKAEILRSDSEKVVVYAPSDIQEYISVENSAGNLHIHFKTGTNLQISKSNIDVKIYARDFNSISASSSARIKVKDRFKQNKISITTSSSGIIEGDFEAKHMDLNSRSSGAYKGKIQALYVNAKAASSGYIFITGRTKDFNGQVSSSGRIKAEEVHTEIANVAASSSGSISILVSERAVGQASSIGHITFYKKGNPSILQKQKSGGSISIL